MRRVLMYSQDGMGLGHLRRSTNIARALLERDPKANILILADSPATSLLAPTRGIDVLKLPTIVKTASASWRTTSWRTGSLSLEVRRVMKLRARLILQTFSEFGPDTVLVDHMPVGALGELKPMLDRVARRIRRPSLFLGLRDILDAPEEIRRVWDELDAYEYLRAYEAVLVYGSRAIYDATAAYDLLPSARRVIYCNYVSPRAPQPASRNDDPVPFVLMMGGGGGDAFPLASAFVDAARAFAARLGMGAVLLTGPNMRRDEREALAATAGDTVRVESGFGTAHQWIQDAAAVVTLGGYNSLCEVLKWRKRALVVPRPGPSAEQLTRARLFSERSLVRMLHPAELTPSRLTRAVAALLSDDADPAPNHLPPLDGAERSAAVLLGEIPADSEVAAEKPAVAAAAIAAVAPTAAGVA